MSAKEKQEPPQVLFGFPAQLTSKLSLHSRRRSASARVCESVKEDFIGRQYDQGRERNI